MLDVSGLTTVFDLPGVWSGAGQGSLGLGVERGVVELKEWVAFDG